MGAPQTPRSIDDVEVPLPRVAVVEELSEQQDRKMERRRGGQGPRRRGLENELEGERRRPRRRPRKKKNDTVTVVTTVDLYRVRYRSEQRENSRVNMLSRTANALRSRSIQSLFFRSSEMP
ncbi:unnamed protein product [Spodoptera littoralis]|uniref:Uncharacterized protein n=1 Tax=Spodoptera littoralis TaxID=7109 RepID=A0A9P0ILE3_SPOLI|nr:unnamed protein product [Spodoptera littoralis]CAH1647899.1 unnamed protein product [Spodoptera littoralis]